MSLSLWSPNTLQQCMNASGGLVLESYALEANSITGNELLSLDDVHYRILGLNAVQKGKIHAFIEAVQTEQSKQFQPAGINLAPNLHNHPHYAEAINVPKLPQYQEWTEKILIAEGFYSDEIQQCVNIDESGANFIGLMPQRGSDEPVPDILSEYHPPARLSSISHLLELGDSPRDEQLLTGWVCKVADGFQARLQKTQYSDPSSAGYREKIQKYGLDTWKGTCLFTNLYYDHRIASFMVYRVRGISADFNLNTDFILVAGVGNGRDVPARVRVQNFNSLLDLKEHLQVIDSSNPIIQHADTSFLMESLWLFNIGHAVFDSWYPAFTSVVKFGRHKNPIRCITQETYDENDKFIKSYHRNEQVFGVLAGLGHLSKSALNEEGFQVFNEVIVGSASTAAKMDRNVNGTLGGGREFGVSKKMRDLMWKNLNLSYRTAGEHGLPYKVILISNKRYQLMGIDLMEELSKHLQEDPRLSDFSFQFIDWSPHSEHHDPYAHPGDFVDHMHVIHDTDIHVSGPGTGAMYQTFLPDNAVNINMGEGHGGHFFPSFMEEYMGEGSPYIRSLYFDPRYKFTHDHDNYDRNQDTTQDPPMHGYLHIVHLLFQAKRILDENLIPAPVGANLSPIGQVYKAYSIWSARGHNVSQQQLTRLPSLRLLRIEASCGNHFPEEFLFCRIEGVRDGNNGKLECTESEWNFCLLNALEASFDRTYPNAYLGRDSSDKGAGYFETHGKLHLGSPSNASCVAPQHTVIERWKDWGGQGWQCS